MTELDDQNLERAVAQATSPLITEPMDLGPEALKPSQPISLADRLPAQPQQVPELNPDGTVKPKRRGRPPGSKNKTTVEREAAARGAGGGARMVTPPSRTKPTDNLTVEQRIAHKQARAEELATKVAETVNDNLLLLLMSMGAPSQLLYKPGMKPREVKADSKYTELAQSITMSPFQTNIIGRFLAEMEATEVGGKLGTQVADGKGPLIVYGVLSFAAMLQWGKSLKDAYTMFEPMLTQFKAQQDIANQHNRETGGSNAS